MSDHATFERRVLAHLDAGYNLARWLAQNGPDADDVLQDACLRAMKYADSLRADDGRAWFLTIVRRSFYDWIARHRPAQLMRDEEAVLESMPDAAEGPEQALSRKGDQLALADAVAALPPSFREVIVLREMEDLSYREIARITDVPVGTVMSRLSRARHLLRRCTALQGMAGAAKRQPP